MSELLPDTWRLQEEDSGCCHQRRGQRKGPITDIVIWVECYSILTAVLSTNYPSKTPNFMAYMRTITKAHRSFVGEGWVSYDTCYRRKAAVSKSLEWGVIDFTLYNETFTGRAKAVARCSYCSSDQHTSHDCIYAPATKHDLSPPRSRPPIRSQQGQPGVCQLFNGRMGNRCTFNPCKFAHACSDCRGRHPLSACRRGNRPPPEKMPRREYRTSDDKPRRDNWRDN